MENNTPEGIRHISVSKFSENVPGNLKLATDEPLVITSYHRQLYVVLSFKFFDALMEYLPSELLQFGAEENDDQSTQEAGLGSPRGEAVDSKKAQD